jgi:phage protein D
MKRIVTLSLLALAASAVLAKLPAPVLSDEAKAKAAEAAAKTAHGNKVADFQLCRSMDRVAVKYQADAKKAGKDVKPATATPPCADPGAFVYPPPAATATTAAAPAPATSQVPAAAKAPAKKG